MPRAPPVRDRSRVRCTLEAPESRGERTMGEESSAYEVAHELMTALDGQSPGLVRWMQEAGIQRFKELIRSDPELQLDTAFVEFFGAAVQIACARVQRGLRASPGIEALERSCREGRLELLLS
jgi:hypothetical protein